MRIAKTISITLPPELLLKAQETAQREHRTMSELLREALRRYMGDSQDARLASRNMLRAELRRKAEELGVRTEDDVVRIVHEHRRQKHS